MTRQSQYAKAETGHVIRLCPELLTVTHVTAVTDRQLFQQFIERRHLDDDLLLPKRGRQQRGARSLALHQAASKYHQKMQSVAKEEGFENLSKALDRKWALHRCLSRGRRYRGTGGRCNVTRGLHF